MNEKKIFLITGILIPIVFINHLFDSQPKTMYGFSINIWLLRLGWLAMSVSSFANYFKIK